MIKKSQIVLVCYKIIANIVLVILKQYKLNNFSFHHARTKDSELLSVLFKTIYIETYGTEGVTYEFANFIEQQFSKKKIEADIRSKNNDLWIARFKDNPVGVIQLEYNKSCPILDFVSPEINKLYVLRNFYGKGIGKRLMQLAEDRIAQMGENKVWLWVLKSNTRANDFYKQQGFKNIGVADFQMEVNSYTNNVMLKNL